MPDKKIICSYCGVEFIFTEREQRKFIERGWTEPKRCRDCWQHRKQGGITPSPVPRIDSNRLPAGYLQAGYFDEYYYLRRGIFSEDARMAARVISEQGTTFTRIRHFYNQLLAITYRMEQTEDFAETRVKLLTFHNTVEYAKARGVVPALFQEFINKNLALAEVDKDSLRGFLEHYRSVLAYARNENNFTPADWISGRGLPVSYLDGGYYDVNNHLRREVLVDWPQSLVEIFSSGPKPMGMSALRRFYNKLKALESKYRLKKDMGPLLPELYAFERDAAYAANRSVVPGTFVGFIVKNVDLAINSGKDFRGFVEHFQSVVAYGKGKLSEGGSKR